MNLKPFTLFIVLYAGVVVLNMLCRLVYICSKFYTFKFKYEFLTN